MAMRRWGGLGWAVVAVLVHEPASASDTLLVNGHIYTANPAARWAEAIAITGSRIDAVGTNDEIMRRREAHTRVVDLQQRTVIPGIVDAHTHPWLGALALHGFNLATPRVWVDAKDESTLIATIKEYAAAHPADRVLYGRMRFANDVSRTVLDRAVPDRPIVVHNTSEHSLWVNSRALELAGVTDRPVPDAGLEPYVVRDAQGRPTGVLREAAMTLVARIEGGQATEEKLAWMAEALRYLNRYGITALTTATGDLAEMQLYATLRDRGQLTVRTKMAFARVAVNHHLTPQFLADIEQARAVHHDRWLSGNIIKFFGDGAGTPPLYRPDELKAIMAELDARGFQIMTHVLSAPAARDVLDAYAHLVTVNGPRDRRLRIEHGGTVYTTDVPRFLVHGITASMQPGFCCFENTQADVASNVWQTFLRSQVNLAFGSDFPCTFPPDPFGGIQQAVTRERRQIFGPPDPTAPRTFVSPEERLSVEQAVDAYTRNSAWARFSDDHLGTLEAGKEADLAVLTQDIFSVPAARIGNTQVVLTMVGGKVVFDQMK